MPWFFNTVSGELANESGVAALAYEIGLSWHKLKIPGSDTMAQATADAAKEFPASPAATGSQAKGLANVPAGAASVATGGTFTSVQNALAGFYDVLTNHHMWASLGWLLLGVALMIVGVLLWIHPAAIPVPI